MKILKLLAHVLQIGKSKVDKYISGKVMIKFALLVSIFTYSFWTYLPKGFFYKGNALFILTISTYLYANEKRSFYKFLLFEFSLAWFVKETFLDPTILPELEVFLDMVIIILAVEKYGKFN